MKKILITGTSGALGTYLRKYFMDRGYEVIGTVGRSKPRDGEFAISLDDRESLSELAEAASGVDAVIHNAAAVFGKAGLRGIYRSNVKGTENMLWLAGRCGCRNFIQVSTVGVYGIRSLGKNRTEETRPLHIEPYGVTKKMAESRVISSGLPYTVLRLPLIKYEGGYLIEKPIKKCRSVFVKKRELSIVSSVTPEFVATVCEKIIKKGALSDIFNCASHHQTWRDMVDDHCSRQGVEIRNIKRVSFFGAFRMGMVIGPIALFGQHTPSDKLEKTLLIQKTL